MTKGHNAYGSGLCYVYDDEKRGNCRNKGYTIWRGTVMVCDRHRRALIRKYGKGKNRRPR